MARVFVSYAHSSDEHAKRVGHFAKGLRDAGLSVVIDTDVTSPAGPTEQWPRWMKKQIAKADWVLVVIDDTYRRRYDGTELAGSGLGATWEGCVITHGLYDDAGRNNRFIPILFDGASPSLIPPELLGANRYFIPSQQAKLVESILGYEVTSCGDVDVESRIHLPDQSGNRMRIEELIRIFDPSKNLLELLQFVDNRGGRVSCSMEGTNYGLCHNFFERIPAQRCLMGKPSSSLRRRPMAESLAAFVYQDRLRKEESRKSNELQQLNCDMERHRTEIEAAGCNLLKSLTDHTNRRAQLFKEYLGTHSQCACTDYYAVKDIEELINNVLFVRSFQPACEVLERLNTIEEYLYYYEQYRVVLFPADRKPFFYNFLFKSLAIGNRNIRFILQYRGGPEHDQFVIVTDDGEDVQYARAIHELSNEPASTTLDSDGFRDWLKKTNFDRLRSAACADNTPCLRNNAPYCPSFDCSASGFKPRELHGIPLVYETIQRASDVVWNDMAKANAGNVCFRFDTDRIEFGITLVAGYPFEFTNEVAVDELESHLRDSIIGERPNSSESLFLFSRACWHSTLVAFRRSRKMPYEQSEIPDLSIIRQNLKDLKPFDVSFEHLVIGPTGEILLCGVLSKEDVMAINSLRNTLICEMPSPWNGEQLLQLRACTDPPKHPLGFHMTIGNLVGKFSRKRLKTLQKQEGWLENPLRAKVNALRLIKYRQRNLFDLLEPAQDFFLC